MGKIDKGVGAHKGVRRRERIGEARQKIGGGTSNNRNKGSALTGCLFVLNKKGKAATGLAIQSKRVEGKKRRKTKGVVSKCEPRKEGPWDRRVRRAGLHRRRGVCLGFQGPKHENSRNPKKQVSRRKGTARKRSRPWGAFLIWGGWRGGGEKGMESKTGGEGGWLQMR